MVEFYAGEAASWARPGAATCLLPAKLRRKPIFTAVAALERPEHDAASSPVKVKVKELRR